MLLKKALVRFQAIGAARKDWELPPGLSIGCIQAQYLENYCFVPGIKTSLPPI